MASFESIAKNRAAQLAFVGALGLGVGHFVWADKTSNTIGCNDARSFTLEGADANRSYMVEYPASADPAAAMRLGAITVELTKTGVRTMGRREVPSTPAAYDPAAFHADKDLNHTTPVVFGGSDGFPGNPDAQLGFTHGVQVATDYSTDNLKKVDVTVTVSCEEPN
jgi:hypothetical protein